MELDDLIEAATIAARSGGQVAALGGRKFKLWDATTGEDLRTIDTRGDIYNNTVVSSDGMQLAAADEHGTIKLWDVTSGEEATLTHSRTACERSSGSK